MTVDNAGINILQKKNFIDNKTSSSSIAKVFENCSILVTGASGFLGKVLVEKLLFSIPNIDKIYLLIRPSNHGNAKNRLQKIIQNPIFNRVRCQNEQLFEKLIPISGDLMKPELGLSESDIKLLCDNVSIVFHCAATVKFDEPLRVSIQMNVIGTQKLIKLCHKMTKIICVVHTSTAYANCNLERTEEHVYPSNVNPSKLIEATDWLNEPMLNALTPQLLDKRPNTYTYAKALAESQLNVDARGLPLIIVRPSIIGAIWRESLPGWTDNVNGPTGLFAAVGKGALTNMCGNKKANADIIPVDIVSNALIAAAFYRIRLKRLVTKMILERLVMRESLSKDRFFCTTATYIYFYSLTENDDFPIIHCCSGTLNPLKWGRIGTFVEQFFNKFPLDECFGMPSTQLHTNRLMFLLQFYLKHYYPAYAVDIALRILGRKPKLVKVYSKVWRMVETLHYFTVRGWTFESENIVKIWDSLNEEDQKTFNFDVRQVDWDCYLFDYLMGIKTYLLREKLDDLPKARSNLAWVKQVSLYSNAIVWAIIIRLFAWRRTKKHKWTLWLIGCLCTYAVQNFSLRPRVYLKSLEEYRKTALPLYA